MRGFFYALGRGPMRNNKRFLFVLGAFLLIFSSVFVFKVCAQTPSRRILLVHSYHPEYPWVDSITKGVKKAIEGQNVELEIFYMDTKRKTSSEWKVEAGRLAIEKIDTWKPDAVITADDNAQIFVTQNYAGKKGAPYFVFCGVNADPADYGLPASNVTGVIERPHFKESVAYLDEIVPRVRRIAVISDDGPTSVGAVEDIHVQKIDKLVLNYHLIDLFKTWKKRVVEYNRSADALFIYMYHTLKEDIGGDSLSPGDVMKWTRENSEIPTVGFFDFAIKDGMLCGVVESGEEHGFEAARMAMELMNGMDISKLPVKTATEGIKMINLSTAKRLGITIPEEIINSADKVLE